MADDRDVEQLCERLDAAGKLKALHPDGYWMTSPAGAAHLLRLSPKTLRNSRSTSGDPESLRYDGQVWYRLSVLADCLSGRKRPLPGAAERR